MPSDSAFLLKVRKLFCSGTEKFPNIFKETDGLQTGKTAAMALKSMHHDIPSEALGDDICIASDDSLTDWSIPLIGAFDSTAEITAIYAKAHLRALERHFKLEHYCLYQNKQPVSSITLSIKGNIARIDDVGTLPEFQGRGYATKLLKYVLLRAKESGVTDCFLGASDAGLSIYKKLGFKVIFESENYSYQAS